MRLLSTLLLIASVHAGPLIESSCEWQVIEDWGKSTYVNMVTNEATYTKPTVCEPVPLSKEDPLPEPTGTMNLETIHAQTTTMTFMQGAHKAWEHISPHDITLALQADIKRVRNGALNRLAEEWQGPISIAILTPSLDEVLEYVTKESNLAVKSWADVHAVVTPQTWKLYPINRMRNYSIKPVKTDYVFVLDIDEHIPYPMSFHLSRVTRAQMDFPQRSIFVLSSWQWATDNPPKNRPQNIVELSSLADRGEASIKHPDYPAAYKIPGIGLKAWRSMNTAREIAYPDGFEPYFIAHKNSLPEFDERFEGFGGDKSVFFLRVATEKFHLVLLPHVFTWSSDSPSDSRHHAPNNNLKLMIRAWKELGRAGGCSRCYLEVCAKNCPELFNLMEPSGSTKAKVAKSKTSTTSLAENNAVKANDAPTVATKQATSSTTKVAQPVAPQQQQPAPQQQQQQPAPQQPVAQQQQQPAPQQPAPQQSAPQQPVASQPLATQPAATTQQVATESVKQQQQPVTATP